jgi:hypothetical protein
MAKTGITQTRVKGQCIGKFGNLEGAILTSN